MTYSKIHRVVTGHDNNGKSIISSNGPLTNVFNLDYVNSDNADFNDPNNDPWYYALFDNNGNGTYNVFFGIISCFIVKSGVLPII